MKLNELNEKFRNGEIGRDTFIDEMHSFHQILDEYSRYLGKSIVSSIEISKNGIYFLIPAFTTSTLIKLKCIVDDKRTTALEIFNLGNYEDKDSNMLFSLVSKDDVIFDVGANIGWYSLNFSKIATNGKIYGFEPIPLTFSILRENIQINSAHNVFIENIALSNSTGEMEFYFNPKETGASSSQNIRELTTPELIKCNVETLDDFVTQNKIETVNLIKCDVEGGEFNVFKGATKTLEKYKPIVFTEMLRKWAAKFNYHPNDIINLFTNFGYTCYYVKENKFLKLTEMTDDIADTNFFFLNSEKHNNLLSINI